MSTITAYSTRIDPRTPEGRKALRLMTVPASALIAALGLPARSTGRSYYSMAELCLMAVDAGIGPKELNAHL